jgi:hypothetical protein
MAKEELETKATKNEEKVEVSKEVLEQLINANKTMIADIAELKKSASATSNPNNQRILKTPKSKEIGIREYNKKIVVGWENIGTEDAPEYVYSEYDEKKREFVQYINLFYHGEKKAEKTQYVQYLRNSRKVWFTVKKEVENSPLIQEQGFVQQKQLADNGYGMMLTDVIVPLEVITRSKTFVVDIGGEEVEIHEKFVG